MEPVPPPATPTCELCGKTAPTRQRCAACGRHVCPDCAKTTEPATPTSDIYCLTCWFAVFTTRGDPTLR